MQTDSNDCVCSLSDLLPYNIVIKRCFFRENHGVIHWILWRSLGSSTCCVRRCSILLSLLSLWSLSLNILLFVQLKDICCFGTSLLYHLRSLHILLILFLFAGALNFTSLAMRLSHKWFRDLALDGFLISLNLRWAQEHGRCTCWAWRVYLLSWGCFLLAVDQHVLNIASGGWGWTKEKVLSKD